MVAPIFNGRLVGYARVSTDDQDLALQIDSLAGLGVVRDNIFTDKVSGSKTTRPGLDACLAHLRQGDTLVVWRLDRLGRSMHHLVELIEELRNRDIGFRSVNDGFIDTTSASGELIFHIFSALAQFERRLIQERTKAGLASARRGAGSGVAHRWISTKLRCGQPENCTMITRLLWTTSARCSASQGPLTIGTCG